MPIPRSPTGNLEGLDEVETEGFQKGSKKEVFLEDDHPAITNFSLVNLRT